MKFKFSKKYKHILYNCIEAQQLAIKKEEEKLNIKESIRLKIHLNYCKVCKEFYKFSIKLDKLLLAKKHEIFNESLSELSDVEKKLLQQKIDELKKKDK